MATGRRQPARRARGAAYSAPSPTRFGLDSLLPTPIYMMMSPRALLSVTASLLCSSAVVAQASMVPLPGFGTNGWLAPGTTPYITTGNTERGMSYNPQTGNLVLVARQNVAGVANNVRVINGATGADLGGLNNTGIAGGTFLVNMVDVAADGSIYVANLATSATANFKVYKWTSEASGFTTPPAVVFDIATGVTRLGDSFAVTGGSGSNPVIFAAAGTNNVSASNFAVGTTDASNSFNAYLSVPGTGTASNDYRLSLSFVDQDTVIGNQGGLARVTSFAGSTATLDASVSLGGAAQRALDYAVIGNTKVLAVIDSNSSLVTLLNVNDPANPWVIATANNTSGTLTANANGTGAVAWGAISGNTATLYAMNSNQGIQAFQVTLNPIAQTVNYGTGCDSLSLAGGGVPNAGNANFTLVMTGLAPAATLGFMGLGTVVINPGLDLTGIGMAGCALYSNQDIGLFATPAVNGVLTFPLAIPASSSVAGAVLSAQGVAPSGATVLGLASSNGTEIRVGF